jgi:hypothetical protein
LEKKKKRIIGNKSHCSFVDTQGPTIKMTKIGDRLGHIGRLKAEGWGRRRSTKERRLKRSLGMEHHGLDCV